MPRKKKPAAAAARPAHRPNTGKTALLQVWCTPELIGKVDDWRRAELIRLVKASSGSDVPTTPTRADAVRQLIEKGLAA